MKTFAIIFIFVIFLGILLLISNSGESVQTISGKVNGVKKIGSVSLNANNTKFEHWYSIAIDTDGNGTTDFTAIDHAQGAGFKDMPKNTHVKAILISGSFLGKFLPFLWGPVLDPDLPGSQPQPIYLATGYSK